MRLGVVGLDGDVVQPIGPASRSGNSSIDWRSLILIQVR